MTIAPGATAFTRISRDPDSFAACEALTRMNDNIEGVFCCFAKRVERAGNEIEER